MGLSNHYDPLEFFIQGLSRATGIPEGVIRLIVAAVLVIIVFASGSGARGGSSGRAQDLPQREGLRTRRTPEGWVAEDRAGGSTPAFETLAELQAFLREQGLR